MSERIVTESEIVPLSSLKQHPRNPNKGNVPLIKESLDFIGQYVPILVHRSTRNIIAGNHTAQAAKALGWSNISVNWFDGPDQEALEILLDDNRASDGAVQDDALVFTMAQSLPSLVATGYSAEDLRMPDIDLTDYSAEKPEDVSRETKTEDKNQPYRFVIGKVKGAIDRKTFDDWRGGFPKRNSEAVAAVLSVLGLEVPDAVQEEGSAFGEVEAVDISDLRPFPGNPNQGDVGLLTELLKRHGQTRPIVVSRRTNRILRGNHVAKAAEALGWKRLGVSWVDVDSDTEKRIVLVDNRSRQLGSYNMDDLGSLLSELGRQGVRVVGFPLEDLDDIIAGRKIKAQGFTKSQTDLVIGPLKAKVQTELVIDLNLTQGQELVELAMLLGLDPQKVVQL